MYLHLELSRPVSISFLGKNEKLSKFNPCLDQHMSFNMPNKNPMWLADPGVWYDRYGWLTFHSPDDFLPRCRISRKVSLSRLQINGRVCLVSRNVRLHAVRAEGVVLRTTVLADFYLASH